MTVKVKKGDNSDTLELQAMAFALKLNLIFLLVMYRKLSLKGRLSEKIGHRHKGNESLKLM